MADSVVLLGVGSRDGVGGALARRFGREGLHVLVTGRTGEKIDSVVDEVRGQGGSAEAMVVDVTAIADQDALFARVKTIGEPLAAVIYNAGSNLPIPFEQLTEAQFEEFWRIGCFGAMVTAKRAMPMLSAQERGSMLFTGASASLRGRPMFGHFASAKAGLRNLAQALAREYGPKGIHVGHVIIDGAVNGDIVRSRFGEYLNKLGDDGSLQPDAIADAFWTLHNQHRSAWTHEIDLRPFKETW